MRVGVGYVKMAGKEGGFFGTRPYVIAIGNGGPHQGPPYVVAGEHGGPQGIHPTGPPYVIAGERFTQPAPK